MKTSYWLFLFGLIFLMSCEKENRWKVKLTQPEVDLKFTDISKDFFDESISLQTLQSDYPFFFDASADSVWEAQRKDSLENAVYDSIQNVFAKKDYQSELSRLFSYYHYHFPDELLPQVYTYSSGMQNIDDAVICGRKEGMLCMALDGFLVR